jgi:hypothetical protein
LHGLLAERRKILLVCNSELGIRWTIGDVNHEGFEALQLSICGAWKIFGRAARYLVCVNSLDLNFAREQTGALPVEVEWKNASRDDLPDFLKFGGSFAEGTGWKFCPLRIFNQIPELALDNDCILWKLPVAVERWLRIGGSVIAEDVRAHFGCFASQCGTAPRNSGIRGLAPDFPFENALEELVCNGIELKSEGDEQGLQVASIYWRGLPEVVPLEDVTICSPFPPHLQCLGKCGAHFVGLNTRHFDWDFYGRNPVEVTREHWRKFKPAVAEKVFS